MCEKNNDIYEEFDSLVKKQEKEFQKKGIKIQVLYGNNGAGKTTLFNNLVKKFSKFYTSFNEIFNSIEKSNILQINNDLIDKEKEIIEKNNKEIQNFSLTKEEVNKLISLFKENIKEENINKCVQIITTNKDNLSFLDKVSFEYLDNLSKSYKSINEWKEINEFYKNTNYQKEVSDFFRKVKNFLDQKIFGYIHHENYYDTDWIDQIYILFFIYLKEIDKKIKVIKDEIKNHTDNIATMSNINYEKIGKDDLSILNQILELVLVSNRIFFELNKDINELNIRVNNEIKNLNNVKVSDFNFLSSGEKTLLQLMISFIFLVTINFDENKKYFLVDDCDEVFDGLVRIYCIFLFKLFSERHNINFIIFTHNSLLINEMREIAGPISETDGDKKIKIYFLKKGNASTKMKLANANEAKFLSLSDSIHFIIEKNFWSIFQKEKLKIILYVLWIIRVLKLVKERYVKDYIINSLDYDFYYSEDIIKKIKSQLINFLKISDQEKKNKIEDYFKSSKKTHPPFFSEITKMDEKFLNNREEYFNEINKLDNLCNNGNEWKINIISIKNILHIIFLRRNLRKWINIKYQEIENNEKINGYKHKVEILELQGKISKEQGNKIIFLLVTVDNFFHAENSPNLAIKGIELDSDYLEKIINIFYDIIGL